MKIKINNILKKEKNKEEESFTVQRRRKNIPKNSTLENFKKFFLNKNNYSKGTYILLFAMLCLASTSILFTLKAYKLLNDENYQVISEDEEIQTVSKTQEKEEVQEKEEKEEIQNQQVEEQKIEEELLDFTKPIKGEVTKIYSIDKVIYSKTLDMWKIHDGIDIEGKMGEAVYAAEKGIVEKIFNDSFLGMTVVLSHKYGYKTSYSNLDENLPVKVGQEVKKMQRIGNISDSAIGEIKDSPHLHFMVFKDEKTIDPMSVID